MPSPQSTSLSANRFSSLTVRDTGKPVPKVSVSPLAIACADASQLFDWNRAIAEPLGFLITSPVFGSWYETPKTRVPSFYDMAVDNRDPFRCRPVDPSMINE